MSEAITCPRRGSSAAGTVSDENRPSVLWSRMRSSRSVRSRDTESSVELSSVLREEEDENDGAVESSEATTCAV